MRVLVTGGHGFLGRYVMQSLDKLELPAASYDAGQGYDVRDDSALLRATRGCTHVIHLAGVLGTAELFDSPHEAVDVNVHGTLNVLQVCERRGLGYVGITMPDSPWRNVYSATKKSAVHLAEAWNRHRGVPVSHVRAFNAYGEGQRIGAGHPQKIVPTFAYWAWQDGVLPVWGSGTQTVDLVHARDLARMLVDALAFGDGQTFDGGTGASLSVNEVAEMTIRVAGGGRVVHAPMRSGETDDTKIVASGEGWDLLGWRPEFDQEDFARAVQSYRDTD